MTDRLPGSVRAVAANIRCHLGMLPEEQQASATQLLDRLTSDARMDKVWRELSRKKRVNGRSSEHFFHPASFSFSAQARAKRVRARELHEKGGDDNERIAERLETEASVLERLPKLSVEEWDARTSKIWP